MRVNPKQVRVKKVLAKLTGLLTYAATIELRIAYSISSALLLI